jgi:hypothetical protein
MKEYAVQWQVSEYHTMITTVRAGSPEEAIAQAEDYKGRKPQGEIKVEERS